MKALVTLWFMVVVVWSSQAAELKVATVDLQRLLKEYYRAEEVAKQLEARHDALFKELAELRLDGNRLLKEAHDLEQRSLDLALNETARADTKRSLELKIADFHTFELSYEQTRAQREAEFQNQAILANKRILDEILTTTRGIGEKEGFNLVLNASKVNPTISDVIFTKNVDDITEKVLGSLNTTKPGPEQSRSSSESRKQH
jgi:Skp family chaperone for outer membrane proteins